MFSVNPSRYPISVLDTEPTVNDVASSAPTARSSSDPCPKLTVVVGASATPLNSFHFASDESFTKP